MGIYQGFKQDEELNDSEDKEIRYIAQYGVDWEDLNNPATIAHHNEHNQQGEPPLDFFNYSPAELLHIEVEEPLCPFTPEQVEVLNMELESLPQFGSRVMINCRAVWLHALHFCHQLELQH
jgi:hypothetical protein